jgi:hypothetical protein
MKTIKGFDAVEMKRKGSLAVYERIKDMTLEQELDYWRKQSEALKREQKQAVQRRRSSKPALSKMG